MDISIREYIKNNFKDSDENELKDAINLSIKEGEEEALPGLGVLMEILWLKSSEEERNLALNKIKSGL